MTLTEMEPGILLPAFVAGLLVLATHVPLGLRVLARGIVFIDLAIAQVAALGVIAAGILGGEAHGLAVQAAALGASLAGAVLLAWTEKRWPRQQEALIGTLFVLAASGATLLLANHPQGGEHLRDLLVGQILWVSQAQLGAMAAVTALVGVLWFVTRRAQNAAAFYLLFALSVTASVQLVGVYLVFASLIVPALAVQGLTRRAPLWGWVLGAAGYAAGLILASVADWPAGPTVVWALAVLAATFAALFSRPAPPA